MSKTYDYIIVGGGSAGSILANRLSARSANEVLLCEAGEDTPEGRVPEAILDSRSGFAAGNPRFVWSQLRVTTEAMPHNDPDATRPRLVRYEQARVLGGGSSINGQLANRGAPRDYDEWEQRGASGWRWETVLPYFKKIERDIDFDGPLHGSDGRIPVRRVFPENWSDYAKAVAEAFELAGHRYVPDQNGEFQDGYYPLAMSNLYDRRVSATSLKTSDEVRTFSIFTLPAAPSIAAWIKAWSSACTGLNCGGVGVGFWNSVRILIPSVIISVLAGSVTGYALSHWRIRGANVIMLLLLICAFIPYQVILYPLVKTFSTIGIYGSLPCIIAVHVVFGLPVMSLLFRNFYAGLPEELVKAARIDGAGFWRIFVFVMLPMSVNILIVATILQTTGIWNDYLLGLIFAGRDNIPMTVQLNAIATTSTGIIEYNVDTAAALLTALPPLIVYFVSGRYFVRGITAGAVKG